ncbi:MAG TPA: AMP-binding protein [Negativicutes bacterium]|nr:AMP-binding protein [Negativicutes bacterium]
MPLTWDIDLFRESDAAGIVKLYRAVYGDNYPVKTVYDSQALIRQEAEGDAWRMVARTSDGAVIGHVAFYRSSSPNHGLYEHGQLMVRHDYRQTDVAFQLMEQSLSEIPRRRKLASIWGEAVCNHLFTQQIVRDNQFVEMALEVDLMPADSYAKALGESTVHEGRVSTLVVFRAFQQRSQTLYFPAIYEQILRFLYASSDWGHIFEISIAPLPVHIETQATLRVFDEAGVARLTFNRIGSDFETRLAVLESEASSAGTVIRQVFLRLTEPWVGVAVEILRRRGYFIGGALPRWFDDDGLLMQKILHPPDFEHVFLLTKRARKLRDMIRQDLESVRIRTLGDLLRKKAQEYPNKVALLYPQRELSLTYAELQDSAKRVVKAVARLGIGRGDHAAIWAPNIPAYMIVEFGCAMAGLPLVMVNTNYRAFELEYVLQQSDTRLLFLVNGAGRPGEYAEALQEVKKHLPQLQHIVFLDETSQPGMLTWQEFLAGGAKIDDELAAEREKTVSGSDVFTLQYTSGTTGAPKGAMLSNAAYIENTRAIAERQGLTSEDVVCVPLPFFHAYGCLTVISALIVGATVSVVEHFRAQEMLQVMEASRATAVSGTPTMFVAAVEEMETRAYDLSSLRGGNVAGAFCPPEVAKSVVEKLGAKEFGILYGSTEGLVSIMNSAADSLSRRIDSVGNAMPGYAAKIIDPQTGETVVTGMQGELCIRGASMMTGYYKMEEQTKKTLDEDGWLHTGDLATVDSNGYYFITGRIKDLIIRGGENIYPAEIESFLLSHPKIMDAQIVGIPCEYYGEELVAFVRLKQGQTANVLEIKRYCRDRIAINKVPAMFFFVEQYPLTASGKVQKFKLREMAVERMTK